MHIYLQCIIILVIHFFLIKTCINPAGHKICSFYFVGIFILICLQFLHFAPHFPSLIIGCWVLMDIRRMNDYRDCFIAVLVIDILVQFIIYNYHISQIEQ